MLNQTQTGSMFVRPDKRYSFRSQSISAPVLASRAWPQKRGRKRQRDGLVTKREDLAKAAPDNEGWLQKIEPSGLLSSQGCIVCQFLPRCFMAIKSRSGELRNFPISSLISQSWRNRNRMYANFWEKVNWTNSLKKGKWQQADTSNIYCLPQLFHR